MQFNYAKHSFSRYTLIELMVTSAIIIILISLLLSALNMGNKHRKNIQCLNNLSVNIKSYLLFASDNDGFFPKTAPGLDWESNVGNGSIYVKNPGLMPYDDLHHGLGRIYADSYVNDGNLFYCPFDEKIMYDDPYNGFEANNPWWINITYFTRSSVILNNPGNNVGNRWLSTRDPVSATLSDPITTYGTKGSWNSLLHLTGYNIAYSDGSVRFFEDTDGIYLTVPNHCAFTQQNSAYRQIDEK